MREATEARNDLAVPLRVVEPALCVGCRGLQLGEKPYRLVLQAQVFGVFQRQVNEDALQRGQFDVLALGQHGAGGGQRERVAGKRASTLRPVRFSC